MMSSCQPSVLSSSGPVTPSMSPAPTGLREACGGPGGPSCSKTPAVPVLCCIASPRATCSSCGPGGSLPRGRAQLLRCCGSGPACSCEPSSCSTRSCGGASSKGVRPCMCRRWISVRQPRCSSGLVVSASQPSWRPSSPRVTMRRATTSRSPTAVSSTALSSRAASSGVRGVARRMGAGRSPCLSGWRGCSPTASSRCRCLRPPSRRKFAPSLPMWPVAHLSPARTWLASCGGSGPSRLPSPAALAAAPLPRQCRLWHSASRMRCPAPR